MSTKATVDSATLCQWLQTGKHLSIVDIRPIQERSEWYIPQSIHFDVYNKLKNNHTDPLRGLYLDRTIPVITVCAAGKTSMIAAGLLTKQGFEAYSLFNGMKGWSMAWNEATLFFHNYQIIQLRRTGKGCLSYIISSNDKAIVVDASLPKEIYEAIIKQNNWQLEAVLETHIHADHLSRSKQLAEAFNVRLLLPDLSKVHFKHETLQDDQLIILGDSIIRVIATPGHTVESVSFFVNKEVLLTGDTLFTNGIGRPDLKASSEQASTKAEQLYHSLQSVLQLGDEIIILPAHINVPVDFDGKVIMATIGEVKNTLTLLQLNKTAFVQTILDKLPPTPPNYLAIVELNQSGYESDIPAIELEAGANRCSVS